MTITIIKTDWQSHRHLLQNLREEVFIREQQISAADEWDDQDNTATHYLVYNEQQAIACARMIRHEEQGKIGRVAVLPAFRRRQIATQLLQFIIKDAQASGLQALHLDAQIQVLDLYAKLGFAAEGETFLDAGIKHKKMTLKLAA